MAAANNVFDFEKFKKQQEDTIREFKEQQLSAKSENKNVEIPAKKIREKSKLFQSHKKKKHLRAPYYHWKKVKDKLMKLHK